VNGGTAYPQETTQLDMQNVQLRFYLYVSPSATIQTVRLTA
jgi:hypothetical protein